VELEAGPFSQVLYPMVPLAATAFCPPPASLAEMKPLIGFCFDRPTRLPVGRLLRRSKKSLRSREKDFTGELFI